MGGGAEKEFFYRWSWFLEWITPSRATLKWVKRVIYQGRSSFQDIAVVEVDGEGKTLILDGKTQSCVSDEFIYHEALVHPAMILHGSPERVLILGGGEGATLREVLRYRSVKEAVMVDIDREMIEVAKLHLGEWHQGSFEDPRARIVIDDAWNYVNRAEGPFDVVISDLVDPEPGGPAVRLYTREFYERVESILGEGGVFVAQTTSLSHTIKVHSIISNTIRHVFGNAFSYGVYVPSFDSYWGFTIASKNASLNPLLGKEEFEERAERLLGERRRELRFYDYQSHLHMFSLPRPYRVVLESESGVSTMDNPVTMPA